MFLNKKISSASYLNKSDGLYIPFKAAMTGAYCQEIQQMLDNTNQKINYIDNSDKQYSCVYSYLECRDGYI